MNTLSTRETRTVTRDQHRRLTPFERVHGARIQSPGRGNAVRAAIHASLLGF